MHTFAPVRALAMAAAIFLPGVIHASAQEFPNGPVTWGSPWNAGGANDTLSRAIAPGAEKVLGQPIAVTNRPGASGTIGSASVATAGDAGHSVVLGSTPTHATAPHVYASLPYDPATDFAPVTLVGVVPNVLVVNPELPVSSVKELIEYAKEHPGELNFYSTGPGTSQHLSAALFGNMTGDHLVLEIFTDLTKLVIPVMFYFLGAFVSLIQAFVFTLLTVIYVSLAVGHEEGHH